MRRVSGELCAHFLRLRRRLQRRLAIVDQVGFEQVRLIKELRSAAKPEEKRRRDLVPLLLSINCIAAGIGWIAGHRILIFFVRPEL